MKKRTAFKMPQLNTKATKKKVEEVMEDYRYYLATLPRDRMPKVIPAYADIPPSVTYQFHSSTEDVAIERVEFERERNAFMEYVHNAVNTLREIEFLIITRAYMEHEIGYDPDIWAELGIGRTKYYVMKGEAILSLAYALKVEVYKKQVQLA